MSRLSVSLSPSLDAASTMDGCTWLPGTGMVTDHREEMERCGGSWCTKGAARSVKVQTLGTWLARSHSRHRIGRLGATVSVRDPFHVVHGAGDVHVGVEHAAGLQRALRSKHRRVEGVHTRDKRTGCSKKSRGMINTDTSGAPCRRGEVRTSVH